VGMEFEPGVIGVLETVVFLRDMCATGYKHAFGDLRGLFEKRDEEIYPGLHGKRPNEMHAERVRLRYDTRE
jgi:hypothetical protein